MINPELFGTPSPEERCPCSFKPGKSLPGKQIFPIYPPTLRVVPIHFPDRCKIILELKQCFFCAGAPLALMLLIYSVSVTNLYPRGSYV